MTAKPVPEHISDERLAEMLALLDGKLPLRRTDNPDYAEIDGANWLQAMCIAPDALMLLNDVPSLLTELQHRREAEAGAVAWRFKMSADGPWHFTEDPNETDREDVLEVEELGLLAASPASGVRVKALEWSEVTSPRLDGPPEPTGDWEGNGVTGIYSAYVIDGYFEVTRPDDSYVEQYLAGVDEAKAAAQSDYEALIHSALGEHP